MVPIHFRALAPAFGAFMLLATTAHSENYELPADADLNCEPVMVSEYNHIYNFVTEWVSYNPTDKSKFDEFNSQIRSMTEAELKQELSKVFEDMKQRMAIKVRTTDNGLKIKLMNEGGGDVQDFTWIHASLLGLDLLGAQTEDLNISAVSLSYETQLPSADSSDAEWNKFGTEAANILIGSISDYPTIRLNVENSDRQKARLTYYPEGMLANHPDYQPSWSYECAINSF